MSEEEILNYVRLTKVWDTFRDMEARISGEAKPKIIDLLNKTVYEKIGEIIDTLPKKSKGPNKGELKRKTIKVEDLEKL
ncbi:MAG: hypothetical protein GF329_06710 [Candidatus Lokiarchaeota archaeon]|nr:hypothetical protein [Candidatus Lokiarchaeota archaeon]